MVAMKADLPMFSPMGAVLDWLSNLPRIILGLAGAVICNALLGLLIERTLMRPLIGQSTFAMIMITVGLISVLSGTKGLIWTADAEFVPHIAPNTPIRLNLFDTPIFLFGADLVNVAVALLLFGRWSDAVGRRPVLIAGAVAAKDDMGVAVDQPRRHQPPAQVAARCAGIAFRQVRLGPDPADSIILDHQGSLRDQAVTPCFVVHRGDGGMGQKLHRMASRIDFFLALCLNLNSLYV